MNRFLDVVAAVLALFLVSGSAHAVVEPPLTTVTPESVREWVASRGGARAEKTETVEVDLVFNFLKGVGCSDADAKAAADAAAKRANELLKGACVKVNVKEVNNDWEGEGNMGAGADGELTEAEVRKAKKDGLKEVTGPDGSGGTKKGYKVFIVKDFIGNLDSTVGCTIRCEPWAAVQKMVEGTTIGEILAHEIGHSFGKLDDTYEMDDMDCLMYGYVKEGSARMLKEGQGDKIRKGAKDHGRTVKKEAKAPAEAPKQPKPKSDGGISKQESAPIVNPAGEAAYVWVVTPSFLAPDGTDTIVDFTLVRDFSSPDPTYLHLGIDVDGDAASGFEVGPWVGIEVLMLATYDPATGLAAFEAQDLFTGLVVNVPLMVGDGLLYIDEFLEAPLPPSPLLPIDELVLGATLPVDLFPLVVGPAAAQVVGYVSGTADPLQVPLPLDDVFVFPLMPDDFFGRPVLIAPGIAGPGDVIQVQGFGFPPNVPLPLFIDDVQVGQGFTDPFGQLLPLPLPLPPSLFGGDGTGYHFLTGKADPVGPAGTTWVEVDAPCPADLNGDGAVGAGDLAILLAAWGPNAGSAANLNGDFGVNASDLAILLAAWGPCG